MATRKKAAKKNPKAYNAKQDPNRVELETKTHRRILKFFNSVRTPKELTKLPQIRISEELAPGRKRAAIHDPLFHEDPVTLLDLKTAEKVLRERDYISPLHGFSRFDQIEQALSPEILKHIFPLLVKRFSGATYGEWTEKGDVTIGGKTIVPGMRRCSGQAKSS